MCRGVVSGLMVTMLHSIPSSPGLSPCWTLTLTLLLSSQTCIIYKWVPTNLMLGYPRVAEILLVA